MVKETQRLSVGTQPPVLIREIMRDDLAAFDLRGARPSAGPALLKEALESCSDCIALLDVRGNMIYMNAPGMWQMEYEDDAMMRSLAWSSLWPRECLDVVEYGMESARLGRGCRFTLRRPTARGSTRWWDVEVSPVFDHCGQPVRLFCVSRDVTELKNAELSLRSLAATAETLVMEVNHRVTNSLSIIAGLLHMQALGTTDAMVRNCLEEARSRVNTVAHIHRRLAESATHDSVDIGDYVAEVAASAIASLSTDSRIVFRAECEHGVRLQANRAITIALVVAELVSNAVKHAFAGRHGTFKLALTSTGSNLYLDVDDDGPGLPEDFEVTAHRGMGMRIVHMLIRQLNGELSLDREAPGAHFRIVVPRADRHSDAGC